MRRLSTRFIFVTFSVIAAILFMALRQTPYAGAQLTPPSRPRTVDGGGAAPSRGPLTPGETLSFHVSWASFTTAARLDLEVVDQGAFYGQDGYQLRTRVTTLDRARSVFMEIDNQYTSYVHAGTLLPYRIESSVRQGSRAVDEIVNIDQRGRQVRFADESQFGLTGDTYDLTSLVYALRAKTSIAAGKTRVSAIYGHNVVELAIKIGEKQRIETPAGSFDAVRVEINPKGQSKYTTQIWFSDDAQRLPVLITARLPFGEVRAELSGAKYNSRPKQIWSKEKYAEGPKGAGEMYAEVEKARPFAVGERIGYDISWGSFATVGKASFSVRQRGRISNRNVIELVGEASTTGVARSLIEVDDELISVVDAATLFPLRTETRLKEGKRQKQVVADYYWNDGSVKLSNGTHFKVAPQSLDLVSLYYVVRSSMLQPGTSARYNVLDANHRQIILTLKGVKIEQIGTPLGNSPALQVDVMRDTYLVAQVWISQDARRIPLYLAIKTAFGELRFNLATTSGLR